MARRWWILAIGSPIAIIGISTLLIVWHAYPERFQRFKAVFTPTPAPPPTVASSGPTSPSAPTSLPAQTKRTKRPNPIPVLFKGDDSRAWAKRLSDRDYITRREAALALAAIGYDNISDADMAEVVTRSATDTDERTRVRLSILAWEETADPKIVHFLTQVISQDGDIEHVRTCTEACTVLEEIGPKAGEALPALRHAAEKLTFSQRTKDEFPDVIDFAAAADKAIRSIRP